MRNKCKQKIIIIILGIIFALSIVLNFSLSKHEWNVDSDNQNTEGLNLKGAGYWNLTGMPINIDDLDPTKDWAYTTLNYDWCSGSGTWSDPYIIENVIIDGLGSGNCININNSNIFFIIRNCMVYNSGMGMDFTFEAGIKLINTNNGTLINNNCSNNAGNGISLINCINNTILENTVNNNGQYGILLYNYCDNNTVSGNTASNNDDSGLYLRKDCDNDIISGNQIKDNQNYGLKIATNDSQNNLIYYNSFIGTIGWHANDSGTNNHWDNSIIGNYWDNWTSPDVVEPYGIVDLFYWIAGSAGSVDQFPLTETPIHLGEIIHIDDSGFLNSWSETARLKFWCTGSGTYSDPFIIDGLEIDAGGSGSCILIENSNVYFIIRNCIVYNAGTGLAYDAGIKLENTNSGILSTNNCSYNLGSGIFLENDCDNNTISGNTAEGNNMVGIYLYTNCDNNTISENTLNNNGNGMTLYLDCSYNTIFGNTASDNIQYGIVNALCNDNTISENILQNNNWDGIYLWNSYRTELSGNNMKKSGVKVEGSLAQLSSYMIYPNNTVNGRSIYFYVNESSLSAVNFMGGGQVLLFYCNNSVISNVNASHILIGIYLYGCNNNKISNNIVNNNKQNGIYLYMNCDNNTISENYIYFNSDWGIYITSADCTDNIIERNVLVSIDRKFLNDGGTNTTGTMNYFSEILPSFVVEIITQSFLTTEFVVTIKIFSDISFQVSDFSIQIWWNGAIVPSNNIAELGNGLYNVSLTPIFVTPNENPILLNMIISAAYHRDKYFETYLAVDPDTLEKDVLNGIEGIPLVIILIAIISTAAVIGVATVSIILLRKRKRASEVI